MSSQNADRADRRLSWQIVCLAWPLMALLPGAASGAVDMTAATAFFKDFDTQTLSGKGPIINQVYGVLDPTDAGQVAAAQLKAQKDVFDGFGSTAQRAITLEAKTANGKAVAPADQQAVNDAYKKLCDDGVMARLSQLQLGIIKTHFNNAGAINYDDLQTAMEWFANGQLRAGAGAAGQREMDQLHQWFVWKQFAIQAINCNVDKAAWQQVLPMLETGLEIYQKVYPAPDPALGLGDPLTTSVAARFKAANQFSDADRTKLGMDIRALTMDDVLKRESAALKTATPSLALNKPDCKLDFATVQVTPEGSNYEVHVVAKLTDAASGAPVSGATISLDASEVGIEIPQDVFSLNTVATDSGGGNYTAQFLVQGPVDGVELYAVEPTTLCDAAGTVAVPEPSGGSLMVAALSCALSCRRRPVLNAVTALSKWQ